MIWFVFLKPGWPPQSKRKELYVRFKRLYHNNISHSYLSLICDNIFRYYRLIHTIFIACGLIFDLYTPVVHILLSLMTFALHFNDFEDSHRTLCHAFFMHSWNVWHLFDLVLVSKSGKLYFSYSTIDISFIQYIFT